MKNSFQFGDKKILITGFEGMVGSALVGIIPKKNAICIPMIDLDLRDERQVYEAVGDYLPDYIIHLAAKVGGVKSNSKYLGDFFIDNIKINSNVLHAAHIHGVKKTLSLLSTCVYPDNAIYPLTEDQIHNGPPHPSNYSYAYTKRMLDVQSRAYRDQFGENYITVVPNNLYGMKDNFDLEGSHVIPAIIRKIYEAKLENKSVELWGDGTTLREFTYAPDLAQILLFLLAEYDGRDPVNVGNTNERSIKYVANYIAGLLNYNGKMNWNISEPTGQIKKPSDNTKFLNLLKSKNKMFMYTTLEDGLKEVCEWFVESYPNVRGVL